MSDDDSFYYVDLQSAFTYSPYGRDGEILRTYELFNPDDTCTFVQPPHTSNPPAHSLFLTRIHTLSLLCFV